MQHTKCWSDAGQEKSYERYFEGFGWVFEVNWILDNIFKLSVFY